MKSVYWCPTSGEWEHSTRGGFDICCSSPQCPSNQTRIERARDWLDLFFADLAIRRHRVAQTFAFWGLLRNGYSLREAYFVAKGLRKP